MRQPGTCYQPLRLLGEGGMAEVFLARAEGAAGPDRLVALKRIRSERAADGRFVRLFLEEARLAATLAHDNIVRVLDVGRMGGSWFLAMELVDGTDLAELLRGGALELADAVAVGLGVLSGLAYAHDRRGPNGRPLGLIHRDVSPSNVLIGRDGSVKLCDFGIARGAAGRSETAPGVVRGKAPYLSPEQVLGRPLDRRTDLFSLGVVLYEMTVGERPFGRGDGDAIARRIVDQDAPRPSSRRPGYPAELERIVLRALARDPDARYPGAAEMATELEAFALVERLSVTGSSLSRTVAGRLPPADVPRAGVPRHEPIERAPSGEGSWRTESLLAPRPSTSRRAAPWAAALLGLLLVAGALWRTIARPSAAPSAPPAGAANGGERAPTAVQAPAEHAQPPPAATSPRSVEAPTHLSPAQHAGDQHPARRAPVRHKAAVAHQRDAHRGGARADDGELFAP